MSDTTKRAMDQAIADHMEDEYGETPIHWVLQSENRNLEMLQNDAHGYVTECSDSASFATRLGLAMILKDNLLSEVGTAFIEDEDN